MITLTAPRSLKMLMLPSLPRSAKVKLELISPGSALLAELLGRACPVGQIVRNDFDVASASRVTLIATPVAVLGTGVVPTIGSTRVALAPSGALTLTPIGTRVSSTRVAVIPTYARAFACGIAAGARELSADAIVKLAAMSSATPLMTTPNRFQLRAIIRPPVS